MKIITRDMLSIESHNDRFKVVAWSVDGVPCTVDDNLEYEEAMGLRGALKVTIETWA